MSKSGAFIAGFLSCAALVVAIGWLAAVRADEWATATCCSHHFQRKHYNERNWGIGFEGVLNENWRILAGLYDNSLYRPSIYGGAAYTPWRYGGWRFGAVMGLFTGYTDDYPAVPMAAPTAMWEGESVGVNLIVVPVPKGVIGLQFKVRF